MEIYSEQELPPAPPTATTRHKQHPTTARKTAGPRKLFAELENGTVRKTTGKKRLMTPATARRQLKSVSFAAPSSSRHARPEEDEEREYAAGRTYKEDIAFQKLNGGDDDDDEDEVAAWSRYLSEPPSVVFVMPDATALDAELGPPIAREDEDESSS